MHESRTAVARCGCGHVALPLAAGPLFRAICHCGICQQFNEADYADILAFGASDVATPEPGQVAFRRWRPPPNVQRGTCTRCGKPALELFRAPLLPKLAMVPAANVSGPLPAPSVHLFYDRRIADIDDDVPKHVGYWSSQSAFMKRVLSGRR